MPAVVELVDTTDLKSVSPNGECGFEPRPAVPKTKKKKMKEGKTTTLEFKYNWQVSYEKSYTFYGNGK